MSSKKILCKEIESKIDKEIAKCEEFHFAQSSKVSSISRNIIFGIIGTLWILLYSQNGEHKKLYHILIIALCGCFVYLIVDLVHYFWDACSYRSQSFRIDYNRSEKGILYKHNEYLDIVSKRSFACFVLKFIMVIIVSTLFIIGMVIQLDII